ncbi:MAG: type II toxin-antitoxin system Phd/YefM family antitoxin [Candidatus Cloacimonetes bacterium]|nr:type II toxin-antitoxin system Phd/YefM family antitoxin [Candidatus Cloacimonadota bacterium]MCF8393988.1 type II toxin-antitoxin system Phd/YefM family antitoxin [Melioribacteraceae bacterium]
MLQVNIHEAKTNLSKLIEKTIKGEEIIIAKSNKPIAKLVKIESEKVSRVIGKGKGKIVIADDFDEIPEGFEDYIK